MPAYNAAATICDSIDSVLDQTCSDWELVVVDDGSTDSTFGVAKAHARDVRVKVLTQENAGAAAARNAAVSQASGDYLVFLDSDDFIDPEYLNAQSQFIEQHPGYSIYSVYAVAFDAAGVRGDWHPAAAATGSRSFTLEDLLTTNPIYITAAVDADAFRAIGGFDTARYAEDFDLWARLLAAGYRHITNPQRLARYRVASASKSTHRDRELESVAASLESVAAITTDESLRHKVSIAAQRAAALSGRYCLELRAQRGDLRALGEIGGDMRAAYGGSARFLLARLTGRLLPGVYLRFVASRRSAKSERRRFGANVRANALLLAGQTAMGLWFAPFLIRNLGMAAYGLIPLANSVASYMSVLEISVRGSLSRELSRAFTSGGRRESNAVYNSVLWGGVGLAVALLMPALGIAGLAPVVFNVPPGYETSARVLFAAVLVMYLVGMVRSIMTTVPFTRNRLDVQNITPLTELVIRVVVVVVLFTVLSPRIEWVAVSLVVSGIGATLVAAVMNRRIAPELKVRAREFSISRLRGMLGTSGWMMVNQFGTLLFLSIDVVVVNLVLGPTAAGNYGSLLIWSAFLRSLAAAVSSAVTPVVLRKYAVGDHGSVSRVMGEALGLLGMGLGLPVGAVCGFAGPLLAVWLGPEYLLLVPLLIAQVFHLSINLAVLPLFSAQLAAGKVKVPGIVTLGSGIANVVIAAAAAAATRSPMAVALAGAAVLTMKNAFFTTFYTAKVQGDHPRRYLASLLKGVIVTLAVFVLARLSLAINAPEGWFALSVQGGVVCGAVGLAAYALLLTEEQRKTVLSLVGVGR